MLIALYCIIHITIMLIVHRLLFLNLHKNQDKCKWWYKALIFVYLLITPMKLWGNLYGVNPRGCNKRK